MIINSIEYGMKINTNKTMVTKISRKCYKVGKKKNLRIIINDEKIEQVTWRQEFLLFGGKCGYRRYKMP